MSGVFFNGAWHENTDMKCRRCGGPLFESDLPDYAFQCFTCDEDFYSFEAEEQDPHYFPRVMVARPVDGITINEQIEYVLDDSGKPRIWNNQPEAEAFLFSHGIPGEDLEHLYFVECDNEPREDTE